MVMTPELSIVNPLSYPGWDAMLGSHPEHSFFHTSMWARTLYDAYKFNPLYFAAVRDGRLEALVPVMEIRTALMPRKGVSLPFTDASDPILDIGASRQKLYDHVISYGREAGWKYLEIRGGDLGPEIIPSSTYFSHTLKLDNDEDRLLSTFSSGTKGNIKKAVKEGVEVSVSQTAESLDRFFRLHSLTRKRHGVPPQPYSFFKTVLRHVLCANNGIIVLASLKGRPIAGAMFFHFGTQAVYKYAASDMEFQNVRANNLVMWEAAKWYCRNRYTRISFGRTEPDNAGLRHFKSGWGTREEVLKYYKYDFTKKAYVKDNPRSQEIFTAIFRSMPLPVLNAVGSFLYKYVA
jgi:hypothetical protein